MSDNIEAGLSRNELPTPAAYSALWSCAAAGVDNSLYLVIRRGMH
jgi:hypothetical protein